MMQNAAPGLLLVQTIADVYYLTVYSFVGRFLGNANKKQVEGSTPTSALKNNFYC